MSLRIMRRFLVMPVKTGIQDSLKFMAAIPARP
jgi:hypothetical protein